MSSYVPAKLRYRKTIDFLEKHVNKEDVILDLGTENLLSNEISKRGYTVKNTQGEDFDFQYKDVVQRYPADCYTSFEVFEHLLAPFNILQEIPGGKLVCSVPLQVWFAKAYWNDVNEWDRHYHEFEPRQFDWLLEKTGWEIKDRVLWNSPDKLRYGLRPILRYFVPSFYFVYAEKKNTK